MLGYYLALALHSLRRNPVLTALMIIAVGAGIGACMTTLSIFRVVSGDPIPAKSDQLFAPQIDNFGPAAGALNGVTVDRLPPTLTYRDATALMRAHAAEHQLAMFPTAAAVYAPNPDVLPFRTNGRATYADFFGMFDVPFAYGGPWSAADDAASAPVIVLSRQLNDELFHGVDSTGRTVRLDHDVYRIVGVNRDWYPIPPFYDLGTPETWGAEKFFVPFTAAVARGLPMGGRRDCPKGADQRDEAVRHSECDWVKVWVELPEAAALRSYRAFLTNYAAEQRNTGRFRWTPRIALRNVPQWLRYNNVIPNNLSLLVLISFAFLMVCVINGVALLLAKFMITAPQVEVRRAMGASTAAIVTQCLVEAGIIGLAGGVVGIALSVFGLRLAQGLFSPLVSKLLTQLSVGDLCIAVALSVAATVLAGLYPTWRAVRIQAARRRAKVGGGLIALQMAVTLAILCNAVFIVQQNLAKIFTPSGVDEKSDFVVMNFWVGNPTDLNSRIASDMAALRSMPSVQDAYPSNSQPFEGGGLTAQITLQPDKPASAKRAAVYYGDDHAMNTLGLKLDAGRNFTAQEINDYHGSFDQPPTSGVLVTKALARQLAAGGQVLGRIAILSSPPVRVPIIGIIDTLAVPFSPAGGAQSFANSSIVLPYRYIDSWGRYLIRAKPGELAVAMRAAPIALARVNAQRITDVQSLADARREMYRGDRTVALILSMTCLILLAVTAFGIFGLTSYWVSQRRHQIGVRRALGATRATIVRHFQTENLLIAVSGVLLGVVFALAGNLWIVKRFAMDRLPLEYLLAGATAIVGLGQMAVLWPALSAASVPPIVATRGD